MTKRFLLILLILSIWRMAEAKIIEGIVAKVNNEIITLSELEAAKRAFSNLSNISPDQIPPEAVREILEKMIESRLILQEARDRGIKISSSEIEKAVDRIRSSFKNEEEFKEALSSQEYTLEDLKRDCEEDLMRQKLIDQEVRSQIKLTQEELEKIRKQIKAIKEESITEEELIRLEQEAILLLSEEKFRKRLSDWLKELSKKAYIEVRLDG